MIRSRLATIMAERDERQDEMAEKIGVSKATLSNIANNRTAGLQYSTLEKIAIYLNVSIEDLFDFSPYMFEFALKHEIEIKQATKQNEFWGFFDNDIETFLFGGSVTPEVAFTGGEVSVIGAGMSKDVDYLSVSIAYDKSGSFDNNYFVEVPKKFDNFDYVARIGVYNDKLVDIYNKVPFAFQKKMTEKIEDFVINNYSSAFIKAGFSGTIMFQICDLNNQVLVKIK